MSAEGGSKGTFQDKAKPALVRESNIMAAKGELGEEILEGESFVRKRETFE